MGSKFAPPTKKELEAFEASESNLKSKFAPPTEQELKAFEDSERIKQPEEVKGLNTDLTAPVAGYATGKIAQKGIEKGIEKTGELAGRGLEKIAEMGGTSPEQLKLIKENFKTFKAMDPMARVNSFLDKSRKTNLSVNEMYAEAEKLLVDKKITPDEYKNIVQSAILEKDKYGRPTFARPVSQSEIEKADTKVLSNLKDEAIKKEERMLNEFARLKAEEAVKKADFEYKITNATNQQLPKSMEAEIREGVINNIKSNPQESGFRGLGPQLLGDYDYKIGKEIEKLQTPLSEEFPFLEGTSMDPKEAAAFQKILKIPGTADITGDKLQEYIREARSKAFLEDGRLSSKPSAAFAAETRKKISNLSPEAGKLMEAETIELGKLEALENAGYIDRTGEGLKTKIEMTDTQRNKLVKDLSTSYKGSTPTDVVENLQVLKDYLSPDQFKKLELAAIKLSEQKGGGIDYVNANKIDAILQGITKRSISRGVATLPESVSLALPRTTAIAKTIGKGALKSLPYLGAGLGGIAAQAAEEGLDSTESGATPTTISEDVQGQQFSPFWEERGFTPSEALEKAKIKSFEEEYGTQPKTIQQQYPSNLALEGMMDIAESPEITAQREMLQQQKQSIAESKKLREERRLETQKVKQMGALAPTYVEAPLKQVLKADNPSEINSTAQSLQSMPDKASQEYGRVLSQIVNSPMSQKEAVLFGLNQQPAFRELLRKLKGNKE